MRTTRSPAGTSSRRKPSKRKRGAPTIVDVAAHVGCGSMTVSRVINGESGVSSETRKVVQAAIAKLNYSPNLAARALAGARPICIGLVYSNPDVARLGHILIGSLEQARVSQVQLVVRQCDSQKEAQVVRDLLAAGIDGILLAPPLCDSQELQSILLEAGTFGVALASANPRAGISAVHVDDHAAASGMVRHLLSLGHRRIGYIAGGSDQAARAMRLEGYKTALAEAEIPIDDMLICQGPYRSGFEAADRLLSLPTPPTAIFAGNDDLAAGALAAAHRHRVEVPRELTICGFDDTGLSQSTWPKLTTIRQPMAAMAREAMLLLLKQIRGRRVGREVGARHILIDYTLVKRQSDGPAHRNADGTRTENAASPPGSRAAASIAVTGGARR